MLIEIIILICLILLAIQDFKSRHVSSWLLTILFIAYILNVILHHNRYTALLNGMCNIIFLILQLCMVTLFFYIKEKNATIIDTKIGLGDIVALIILSIGFSFKSFLIYYIVVLLISLIITILFNNKDNKYAIPLVSYMSMIWVLFYIISKALNKNLFYL